MDSSAESRFPKNAALGLAAIAVAIKRAATAMASDVASAPAKRELDNGGVHDNHPFFHYYGLLVHQQNMLQDTVRTGAYHDAMIKNASDFKDKVVVDVGTGSGILAYFAIKAGARKVYAIEASSVADRAAQLMAANGLSDRIVVLKQTVETAELPEKADIIISEPMGFMLIHERMLESYIIARKRFLKPGGLMFPTTGTIFTAPFTDATLWTEQASKVAFWHNSDFFGLDLTSLADAASKDHFSQPVVGYIDPSSLMAGTTVDHTIDFANDAPESLQTITIPFEFTANRTGVCHGLAAWFDVAFNGSTERVVLNTGPYYPGTHWYQCRLLLREPIAVNAGQRLSGQLLCVGNERYSYNLTLSMKLVGSEATTADGSPIASSVALNLHDQMYHYLNNASYGQPVAGTNATS